MTDTSRRQAMTVPEAELKRTDAGLIPQGEGWFVLNARESRWYGAEGRSAICAFEGDVDFAQLGINVSVIAPGGIERLSQGRVA